MHESERYVSEHFIANTCLQLFHSRNERYMHETITNYWNPYEHIERIRDTSTRAVQAESTFSVSDNKGPELMERLHGRTETGIFTIGYIHTYGGNTSTQFIVTPDEARYQWENENQYGEIPEEVRLAAWATLNSFRTFQAVGRIRVGRE